MSTTSIWYFIQWLHYLALSLWVGGITFLCAVVAPAVHKSMASRAVAGQIVSRALKQLNFLEMICFMLLLATSFLSLRFVAVKRSWLWGMIVIILCMGGLTSVYSFFLAPKLEALKESVPTFDSLSSDHPSKIEFNRLHRQYVMLMTVNLVLGLLVLYGSVIILK